MDYYINWGLCNLPTFKLPGVLPTCCGVTAHERETHQTHALHFCLDDDHDLETEANYAQYKRNFMTYCVSYSLVDILTSVSVCENTFSRFYHVFKFQKSDCVCKRYVKKVVEFGHHVTNKMTTSHTYPQHLKNFAFYHLISTAPISWVQYSISVFKQSLHLNFWGY